MVGAVKSVLKAELDALKVPLAAETLLKVINDILNTIIIDKNNFTLILQHPYPKNTTTKFYNLILHLIKSYKHFRVSGYYNILL